METGYPHAAHVRPALMDMLHAIGMDVSFERAEGNYLFHRRNGESVPVLDLVGGYGTLLLGHHHPELRGTMRDFLDRHIPVHDQGSCRMHAARLAESLLEVICDGRPDYRVIYGNSGAEGVEIALKHALLECTMRRSRGVFIAIEGGFHGKTLAAVQMSSNMDYRGPFCGTGTEVVFARRNDINHLRNTFRNHNAVACILEPIQGEGGVFPLLPEYVREAERLCRTKGIPLIVDECQTGLGRTGRALESTALGITPDYLILSKVLSGGLVKISATLIRSERYRPAIDLLHTSTYGGDALSSIVALKVIEIVRRNDFRVIKQCAAKGGILLEKLRCLRGAYPEVIRDVRGRGLMIGIQFSPEPATSSRFIRAVAKQRFLGYLVSAHLFWRHRIRIAPTLSEPQTLRVQPSAFIDLHELDRFVTALAEVCDILKRGDGGGLVKYLVGNTA